MEEEIIIIEEPEQVVEIIDAEAESEKAVVVTPESEIKRFESALSAINSRLTAQEEFNKEVTYTESIDTDIAYEKAIPTDARLGFIDKIGGMSQKIGNELIIANVESVSIESKTIPMPSELKRRGIYGINENIYDCIDIENKQLVKRCGTFLIDDASTIRSIEPRTNSIRIQYKIEDAKSGYTECVFSNLDYLRSWDSEVTHGYMYNNTARVILNGITTQADALTWLRNNPVTVVYELATPVIEDLAGVLHCADIVQPFNCNGGTITFNQTQQQKVEIPNEVRYLTKK